MTPSRETNRASSIQIRNLSKWYSARTGGHVHALDKVNLDIEEREFIALLGASGCGKSTLLKVVAGLLAASTGEVVVDGTAVTGPRQGYGYVFQESLLLPWRSVLKNVMIVAEVQGLDKTVARRRARELLELVGLGGFENKYPGELSGGMQQRVAVVRALVNNPTLLLMDEPFAALDALTRESMALELLRIWSQERKTVIFVTHSIPEAVLLADRVVTMSPRPGRVSSVDTISLPRPRTQESMATPEFARIVGKLRGQLFGGGSVDEPQGDRGPTDSLLPPAEMIHSLEA